MTQVKEVSTHHFHSSILRAYDIRGVFGETLTVEDSFYVGRAMGTYVASNGKGRRICVGFDGRLSSPELEESLVKGLMASGIDVIRIGLGPTPMLYFSVKHLGADAGVMITGSHNPPNHNGFKCMMEKLSLHGEQILQLGRIAKEGSYIDGNGSVAYEDVKEEYLGHLLGAFKGRDDLKIAWDAGNGAAGEIMSMLTERLPGHHLLLNEKIDGKFPSHHPDPSVPENLLQLINVVKSHSCDLGIAFDGDGDRLGVVDNAGNIIWGDQLMTLFAKDILEENPGRIIIADVKASQVLFDEIDAAGGKPLMWKTGHSLIKAKMAEVDAVLAGEMSGHVFFAENFGFDDGLYAAIKLLNVISASGMTIENMVDLIPSTCSTQEMRIDVNEERKFDIIEEVKSRLRGLDVQLNEVDGVRVMSDAGWWLLRASNTQAALVARCEAANLMLLEKLKKDLQAQLELSDVSVVMEAS